MRQDAIQFKWNPNIERNRCMCDSCLKGKLRRSTVPQQKTSISLRAVQVSNLHSDFTRVEFDYEVWFRRLRHIHQRGPSSEQSPISSDKVDHSIYFKATVHIQLFR